MEILKEGRSLWLGRDLRVAGKVLDLGGACRSVYLTTVHTKPEALKTKHAWECA